MVIHSIELSLGDLLVGVASHRHGHTSSVHDVCLGHAVGEKHSILSSTSSQMCVSWIRRTFAKEDVCIVFISETSDEVPLGSGEPFGILL